MTRNEMRDWIGGCMFQKGFHDDNSGFADGGMVRAGLIGTEIVEAMQEFKRHWPTDGIEPPTGLRDTIAKELADTAIRLYDLAFLYRLDLEHDELDILEQPRDIGRNERHSLMIRCGKVMEYTAYIFTVFEDLHDSEGVQTDIFHREDWGLADSVLGDVYAALVHCESLCERIGRDLGAAIDAKMAENMTRPHKYGTPDAASVTQAFWDAAEVEWAEGVAVGNGSTKADWLRYMAEKEDGQCITVGHIDKAQAVAEAQSAAYEPEGVTDAMGDVRLGCD